MDGQGRRKLLTPDEVLRLPNNQMLCIVRGCNVLILEKMDYTKHPYAKQIVRSSIMDYEPIVSLNEFREMVRREQEERGKKKAPKPKKAQAQGIYADLPLDDV